MYKIIDTFTNYAVYPSGLVYNLKYDIPMKAYTKSNWFHPVYGYFIGSAEDLLRQYPDQRLDNGHLAKVRMGKARQHKGWRL